MPEQILPVNDLLSADHIKVDIQNFGKAIDVRVAADTKNGGVGFVQGFTFNGLDWYHLVMAIVAILRGDYSPHTASNDKLHESNKTRGELREALEKVVAKLSQVSSSGGWAGPVPMSLIYELEAEINRRKAGVESAKRLARDPRPEAEQTMLPNDKRSYSVPSLTLKGNGEFASIVESYTYTINPRDGTAVVSIEFSGGGQGSSVKHQITDGFLLASKIGQALGAHIIGNLASVSAAGLAGAAAGRQLQANFVAQANNASINALDFVCGTISRADFEANVKNLVTKLQVGQTFSSLPLRNGNSESEGSNGLHEGSQTDRPSGADELRTAKAQELVRNFAAPFGILAKDEQAFEQVQENLDGSRTFAGVRSVIDPMLARPFFGHSAKTVNGSEAKKADALLATEGVAEPVEIPPVSAPNAQHVIDAVWAEYFGPEDEGNERAYQPGYLSALVNALIFEGFADEATHQLGSEVDESIAILNALSGGLDELTEEVDENWEATKLSLTSVTKGLTELIHAVEAKVNAQTESIRSAFAYVANEVNSLENRYSEALDQIDTLQGRVSALALDLSDLQRQQDTEASEDDVPVQEPTLAEEIDRLFLNL